MEWASAHIWPPQSSKNATLREDFVGKERGKRYVDSVVRALALVGLIALAVTTGCSANNYGGGGISRTPSLGIQNGIWRFPTPRAVPAASSERPAGSATETPGSSSAEPASTKPPRRQRVPRPFAATSPRARTL